MAWIAVAAVVLANALILRISKAAATEELEQ